MTLLESTQIQKGKTLFIVKTASQLGISKLTSIDFK